MEEQQLFSLPEKESKPQQEIRLAENKPVARVILDIPTIQLDRPFDFSVPAKLDVKAQEGVRVRVRFRGKLTDGIILERTESSEHLDLVPLHKVYSELPVLNEKTWALCEAVAARYCCTHRDVLRHMIPPRKATREKEVLSEDVEPSLDIHEGSFGLEEIDTLPALKQQLENQTEEFKAFLGLSRSVGDQSWASILALSVAAYANNSKGSITVLPNHSQVKRLHEQLLRFLPEEQIAVLTTEEDAGDRYQHFAEVALARKKVVIGTRSAIYAPVEDLGLIMVWDELDENHRELSYPHAHTREIALMRSQMEKTSLIFASFSPSCEAQRLVDINYLTHITYDRNTLRELTPLIRSMADNSVLEFDPEARSKRLPDLVFKTIREGLEHGPVLISVPLAGFFPSLSCQNCRNQALCTQCHSAIKSHKETLICTFCSHIQHPWFCSECGGRQLRARKVGSDRTAQELGRSFPNIKIIASSGENIVREITSEPALVVATPGGEPVCPDGYAAAVLLDADMQLYRTQFNAAEHALNQWCHVASLVKVRGDNGKALLVSTNEEISTDFIRWVPEHYVEKQLKDRYELELPPAVRIAILDGPKVQVQAYLSQLKVPVLEKIGPFPTTVVSKDSLLQPDEYRAVIKFSYKNSSEVTKELKDIKVKAAMEKQPKVIIKVDANDLM